MTDFEVVVDTTWATSSDGGMPVLPPTARFWHLSESGEGATLCGRAVESPLARLPIAFGDAPREDLCPECRAAGLHE